MRTHIPLFLLVGFVAASSALADDHGIGDAQSQAASVLKAQTTAPKPSSQSFAADRGTDKSAQAQAAMLLKAMNSPSPATSRSANTEVRAAATRSRLVTDGSQQMHDDAQSQAQRLLRTESVSRDRPKVVAESH